MPVYEIELDDGRVAEIDAESEQAALRAVASVPKRQKNFGEAALTMARGAIAEPVAGLHGISKSMRLYEPPGSGAKQVAETRDFLTGTPSAEGFEALKSISKVVEPVTSVFTKAEKWLGETALDATGSPAIAAAAHTIPTAVLEALGLKGVTSAAKGVKRAKEIADIDALKSKAIPSVESIKKVAGDIYKEIDNLGVTVPSEKFEQLLGDAASKLKTMDKTIHPSTTAAFKRFVEKAGEDVTVTDLDTLRQIAGEAAGSLDRRDARMGALLVDAVDDFMADPQNLRQPANVNVGQRYKVARELWGRARRSEMLEEAFEKARNQASGFENGIVIQFRSILNDSKKKRMFKPHEVEAMQKVVRGTGIGNIAKFIGRMGLFEGHSTTFLGGSIGAGMGYMVAGPAGFIALPILGQVSRKLAQRLTVGNARFADDVIKAGKDGDKITRAYLRNVPSKERSAKELSELLMRPDIDLDDIKAPIGKEAASLASGG